MGISQVSWGGELLKVTPMRSYTHRGHTLRRITPTRTQMWTCTFTEMRMHGWVVGGDQRTHPWENKNPHGVKPKRTHRVTP